MKAFIAACIAAGILWGIDVLYNSARYTDIAKRVVRNTLP